MVNDSGSVVTEVTGMSVSRVLSVFGAVFSAFFSEQVVETIHPCPPELLVYGEQAPSATDGRRIRADQSLPTLRAFGHQSCGFEDSDVFLYRGERHLVIRGQVRHRGFPHDRATYDVSARGIGQSVEYAIHLGIGKFIYNHLVVH